MLLRSQVGKYHQQTVIAGKLVCISWMTQLTSVWLRLYFGRMTNWWGFMKKNTNSNPRISDLSHNIPTLTIKTQFIMKNFSRKRWIRCEKVKNWRKRKMRGSIEIWWDATFESPHSCNIWIRKINLLFHQRQLYKKTVVWMNHNWKTVNQLFLISTAVLYKLNHSHS